MKLLIILVSIIIFSVIGVEEGFADSDDIFTVIASTDKDGYEHGDTITISGHVENYDSTLGNDMYSLVSYTDGTVIYGGWFFLEPDGSFVTSFDISTAWQFSGDYVLEFQVTDTLEMFTVDEMIIKYVADPNHTYLNLITNKPSYTYGDTITISGDVYTQTGGFPVTIEVIHGPSIIQVIQMDVAQDGSFAKTITPEGPLWSESGDYKIKVMSQGYTLETSFNYSPFPKTIDATSVIEGDGYGTFEVDTVTRGTFDIEYTIEGSSGVDSMVIDTDAMAIMIRMSSPYADGSLTLDLPRDFIGAEKEDGTDDDLFYLLNGIPQKVPHHEIKDESNSRVITIDFGRENFIILYGTHMLRQSDNLIVPQVDDSVEELETVVEDDETVNEFESIVESVIDEIETVVEPIVDEIKIASFVEKEQEHYIIRYHSESTYREWFDTNYSEYNSIEKAVGLVGEIPEWTDNIFVWYDQSNMTTDEVQSAIKYLVDEEILIAK